MIFNKILHALKQVKLKQVSIKWQACHLCHWKIQVKLFDDEMGVRCSRCRATPVSQMLGKTFKNYHHASDSVYELSSRGAFVRYLKKQKINLTVSEYFDGVEPGELLNGVLSQNVEHLTFKDESFDICTSLEVFEHVENDVKGFCEIFRVLKTGGFLLFTVPICLNQKTTERTRIINKQRENVLPAVYHTDSIRGSEKVFCYRDYGYDIVQRLEKAGFSDCKIVQSPSHELWGFARPIIVAKKQ